MEITNQIEPWTRQAAFDAVYEHFVAKGAPQSTAMKNGDRVCRYRTEDGKKCAIGVLVPEHMYSKAMEGLMASSLWFRGNLPYLSSEITPEFLDHLQQMHDQYWPETFHSTFTEWMRLSLERFAKAQNLKVPVLARDAG